MRIETERGWWRTFRYSLLLIVAVGVATHIELTPTANAKPTVPYVNTFTFKDAFGGRVGVTSWTEDGVKCSVAIADGGSQTSSTISCVKL